MSDALATETNVSLRPYNSFGLPALARRLVRVKSEADVKRALADPALARMPRLVLGGGSNVVLTRDLQALVLKVEIMGRRVVSRTDDSVVGVK